MVLCVAVLPEVEDIYGALVARDGSFEGGFGGSSGRSRSTAVITVSQIVTPLGAMIAGATADHLCLLEFTDRRLLATQIERLRGYLGAHFAPGDNRILARTEQQIGEYFAGTRTAFDLPLLTPGTEFQQAAWAGLLEIPYGETRSYSEQAHGIGRAKAVRAVGKANGDNRIAVVIPCHRVLGSNGEMTGYGGHVWRKRALLELEQGQRQAELFD